MARHSIRFVGKAENEKGWRIWDRMQKKWWGACFPDYPQDLLDELNGQKRPDRIVELTRSALHQGNKGR